MLDSDLVSLQDVAASGSWFSVDSLEIDGFLKSVDLLGSMARLINLLPRFLLGFTLLEVCLPVVGLVESFVWVEECALL